VYIWVHPNECIKEGKDWTNKPYPCKSVRIAGKLLVFTHRKSHTGFPLVLKLLPWMVYWLFFYVISQQPTVCYNLTDTFLSAERMHFVHRCPDPYSIPNTRGLCGLHGSTWTTADICGKVCNCLHYWRHVPFLRTAVCGIVHCRMPCEHGHTSSCVWFVLICTLPHDSVVAVWHHTLPCGVWLGLYTVVLYVIVCFNILFCSALLSSFVSGAIQVSHCDCDCTAISYIGVDCCNNTWREIPRVLSSFICQCCYICCVGVCLQLQSWSFFTIMLLWRS